MTEDQAKTKWCPFARVVDATWTGAFGTPPHNRILSDNEDLMVPKAGYCIASFCMAWREHVNMAGVGYCGLAGTEKLPT